MFISFGVHFNEAINPTLIKQTGILLFLHFNILNKEVNLNLLLIVNERFPVSYFSFVTPAAESYCEEASTTPLYDDERASAMSIVCKAHEEAENLKQAETFGEAHKLQLALIRTEFIIQGKKLLLKTVSSRRPVCLGDKC